MSSNLTTLISLLAFSCSQSCAADDNSLLALPTPMLKVIKTPRGPVIDGKFADNEWRYAAGSPPRSPIVTAADEFN